MVSEPNDIFRISKLYYENILITIGYQFRSSKKSNCTDREVGNMYESYLKKFSR